jgi:hypothetical protein
VIRFGLNLFVCILLVAIFSPSVAKADFYAVLRHAARIGAGISDDVSIKSLKKMSTKPNATRNLSRHFPEFNIARLALKAADPVLLRKIEELDTNKQILAMQVFDGGKVLRLANPNEVARAKIVVEGGIDALVSAQKYGNDFAKPISILQVSQEAKRLPAGSVARFSRAVADRGEPFIVAWRKHISPNFDKFLATGVIATCITTSQTCIDAAGKVTFLVAKTTTETLIEVADKAVDGVNEGTAKAIENTDRINKDTATTVEGNDRNWLLIGTTFIIIIFLIRWLAKKLGAIGDFTLNLLLSGSKNLVRHFYFIIKNKMSKLAWKNIDGDGT